MTTKPQRQLILSLFLALGSPLGRAQWTATELGSSSDYESLAMATDGSSQGGVFIEGSIDDAVIWNGSANSYVDLNPSGYAASAVYDMSGGLQVGYAVPAVGIEVLHAYMWRGSAGSGVDLNPNGWGNSIAYATDGLSEVGYAYDSIEHAFLWTGSAASAIDLNPSGASDSVALGVNGNTQIGGIYENGENQAGSWHGTAASFTNLNPSGYTSSLAEAISGNLAGGYAVDSSGMQHAFLWNLISGQNTDLTPAGYAGAIVYGMAGNYQVGTGSISGLSHALLWNGTGAGYVDLSQFLPAGFSNASARGVGMSSSTLEVAGYAEGPNGQDQAFLWSEPLPAPEPPSWVIFGSLLASFACFARKRVSRSLRRVS